MASFDIIGSNPYGPQVGGDGSGFDIVGSLSGRGLFGQLASQQGMGQPQGAPVSGSVAGLLGLPTYGGTMPGASYLTPGQPPQGNGQADQLRQLLQMGGLPAGSLAGAAQGQPQNNVGTAIGSGLRSLFDGVVGLAR